MAIRATISLKRIQASTSTVKLTAQTLYEKANATNIWVDPDSNNRFVNDVLPLSDLAFNVFTKPLEDTVVIIDQPSVGYDKAYGVDTYAFTDTFTRTVDYRRSLLDSFTLDDASLIDKDYYGDKGNVTNLLDVMGLSYSTPFTDSYNVGDTVDVSTIYSRVFNDSFGLLDSDLNPLSTHILNTRLLNSSSAAFRVERGNDQVDNFGIGDNSAVATGKAFVETLSQLPSAFSDYDTFNLVKGANETLSLSEVFNVLSTYPKIDSVALSDIAGVELNKIFADGFAVDDATVVDKNYYGNKGNVYNLTDVITLINVFNRQFGDTLGITEVLGSHLSKLLTDNEDTFNISDTINVQYVTGGVLNAAPLNRVNLN